MNDPSVQLYCKSGHPMARDADWCGTCGEPPNKPAPTPAAVSPMRCRWCGGDCPYWGNDVCSFRPRQIPRTARTATEEK